MSATPIWDATVRAWCADHVERAFADRVMTATDLELLAATAVRMDRLVDDLAAACAKGEARQGWVPCRVLRRLLGEVR